MMKLYRKCLLILVIIAVFMFFSIYMKCKTCVTDYVEYHESGKQISSWNDFSDNGYSKMLLELGQLNYNGVRQPSEDAIGPITKLFNKKPPVFLPGFKNPCWYDNEGDRRPQWTEILCNKSLDKRQNGKLCQLYFPRKRFKNTSLLRCLPYFMLIGQPKSGSTDLFRRIMQHPDVKHGISKEPHWWTRSRHCPYTVDKFACKDRQPQSFTEYIDYFNRPAEILQRANATQKRRLITGEGSQSILWDHRWWWWYPKNSDDKEPGLLNAHIIRHILPDVKLLVILRNPVDRLYSSYLYFVPYKHKSAESFHDEVTSSINTINECLRTESLRQCVYKDNYNNRLLIGLYTLYLKDWMGIFPRKQLLVLSLDEYSKKPSITISKIYKFLDLRDIGKVGTRAKHFNERRPSTRSAGQMLNKTRRLLEDFYKPFNEDLALLLNDTKFLWRT